MADFPRRGQIYWVDFNPVQGSEQAGRRPAVIVSTDALNKPSSVVTVVPISTAKQKKQYPQNVSLPENEPLSKAGTVYCAQVRTISKKRLDKNPKAALSPRQMREVERALAVVLELPKPERLN